MKWIIALLFVVIVAGLDAYEHSLSGLSVPSELNVREGEILIVHRFYGTVDDHPLDTAFGLDVGANVGLQFRWQSPWQAGLKASYVRRNKEKSLGAYYSWLPESLPLQLGAELAFVSFKNFTMKDEDREGVVAITALQGVLLDDRLHPVLNLGYDSYYERLLLALGMSVSFKDELHLFAEYYPVLDRDDANEHLAAVIHSEDAFVLGVKLDTYGHHFKCTLSNSTEIGLRRLTLGTADTDLRLGFHIERRLMW